MNRLEQYVEQFSSSGTEAEQALLDELERATNRKVVHPQMVSGRAQGAFLNIITRILRPHRVLEIGTFTGYSALSIAAGLDDDAEIHTIEVDDELEDIAKEFFARSPHGHKIHLHIGSALDVVPQLVSAQKSGQKPGEGSAFDLTHFDLVYIDGDKREYPDYYRMVMGDRNGPAMVKSGTIILTDNVLWYGKVAEPDAVKQADRMSQGVIEFNRLVVRDPRVENVILPLRDGINLIRVK